MYATSAYQSICTCVRQPIASCPTDHPQNHTHLARDPALHLDALHRQRRVGVHQPKCLPHCIDLDCSRGNDRSIGVSVDPINGPVGQCAGSLDSAPTPTPKHSSSNAPCTGCPTPPPPVGTGELMLPRLLHRLLRWILGPMASPDVAAAAAARLRRSPSMRSR